MLPVYSEFYKDSTSYTVLYSVCTVMHIYNIIKKIFLSFNIPREEEQSRTKQQQKTTQEDSTYLSACTFFFIKL